LEISIEVEKLESGELVFIIIELGISCALLTASVVIGFFTKLVCLRPRCEEYANLYLIEEEKSSKGN
jgi:hypothetical protein